MSTYFAILTAIGEAKLANAVALGQTLNLTEMAVGDGNGVTPVPSRTQTALVNQKRSAQLNQLYKDPQNPGQIIAEQVLPENVGGWWIRELGLRDEDGDLCAVANCPPSYKPQLAEGSGRLQVIRMVLLVASTDAIQLKIDPSVVLATRKYVDDAITVSMNTHLSATDPHPQYLTQTEGNALIGAAVAALVNSSPATLDTLAELANALNNDANFAATITNALTLKAALDSPDFTGTPKGPTPPLFDKTTKLATAEFVQRALGSYAGSLQVTANTALTVADVGKYIAIGASGLTITLPKGADLPPGAAFTFGANLRFTLTKNPATTETIAGPTGSAASVAMAGNCSIVWRGDYWVVAMGGDLASVALNGYQKYASGLIIQWATGTNQAAAGNQVITFPITFPNAVLITVVSNVYASYDQSGGFASVIASTSQVTIARNRADNTNGVTPTIISIGY